MRIRQRNIDGKRYTSTITVSIHRFVYTTLPAKKSVRDHPSLITRSPSAAFIKDYLLTLIL
jgi:hypothetical protein